jgi:hypothetical protein
MHIVCQRTGVAQSLTGILWGSLRNIESALFLCIIDFKRAKIERRLNDLRGRFCSGVLEQATRNQALPRDLLVLHFCQGWLLSELVRLVLMAPRS